MLSARPSCFNCVIVRCLHFVLLSLLFNFTSNFGWQDNKAMGKILLLLKTLELTAREKRVNALPLYPPKKFRSQSVFFFFFFFLFSFLVVSGSVFSFLPHCRPIYITMLSYIMAFCPMAILQMILYAVAYALLRIMVAYSVLDSNA